MRQLIGRAPRLRALAMRACVGALVAVAGCTSGRVGFDDTADATDATGGETSGVDADASAGDTGGGRPDGGDGSGPSEAPRSIPSQCGPDQGCDDGETCRDGVCVGDPVADRASRVTDPSTNMATEEGPNLACVGQASETPDGPDTTTLWGAVTRFGGGRKTFDIRVEVYRASAWNPLEACSGEADREDPECHLEYGDPIATTLSEPGDAFVGAPTECDGEGDCPDGFECRSVEDEGKSCEVSLPEECDIDADCPLGYECVKGDVGNECKEQFGLYKVEGVPTNTDLIVRSRPRDDAPDYVKDAWHHTYVFGIRLFADDVDADGRSRYDVTMVSDSQWILTPNSVGASPVPEERGIIGGRVRDCAVAGERRSWPFSEVSLGTARPAEQVVYFNDDEDDTVPLVDRRATNVLGRFAALNVAPGWNRLAGSVRTADGVQSAGSIELYVVPDALTIVTHPGERPLWEQDLVGSFPED